MVLCKTLQCGCSIVALWESPTCTCTHCFFVLNHRPHPISTITTCSVWRNVSSLRALKSLKNCNDLIDLEPIAWREKDKCWCGCSVMKSPQFLLSHNISGKYYNAAMISYFYFYFHSPLTLHDIGSKPVGRLCQGQISSQRSLNSIKQCW